MRQTNVAIAVVFGCAALAGSAAAQAPSYESRGYGGPLDVGPNFHQGGQHAPAVYGQAARKRSAPPNGASAAPRRAKPAPTREAKTDKSSPAPETAAKSDSAADAENSTIAAARIGETDTASGTPGGATAVRTRHLQALRRGGRTDGDRPLRLRPIGERATGHPVAAVVDDEALDLARLERHRETVGNNPQRAPAPRR